MNQYQFEQISRRMEGKYGKMKKNEEGKYAMLLLAMESNVLKIHRKNPEANSRRMAEAIVLTLYEIENRLSAEKKDTSSFETKENSMLKEGLLKSFDPFSNDEIRTALQENCFIGLEEKEVLSRYYKDPIVCLLRIKDSVEHWIKRNGSDGYFEFIEDWMGNKIPNDGKMNYSICIENEG